MENESMVIYCIGYNSKINLPENVEIKKIPKEIVKKFKIEGRGD